MVKDRKVIATADSLLKSKQTQFFALKVQKSAEHYTEAAMDEVELLDCVASERKQCEASSELDSGDPQGVSAKEIVEHSKHVATLHDSFFHTGPNGRHMCMVFSMLGCNLLSVIKAFNYRGIPVPVVKKMIKGICMGLDFLHRKCSIIHTDLKPENILVQFPNQMSEEEAAAASASAAKSIESKGNSGQRNPLQMSIAELEAALKDPSLTYEERQGVQKRLKMKREKESTRVDVTDDDDCDNLGESDMAHPTLSDREMESIIGGRGNVSASSMFANGPNGDASVPTSASRVIRRLSHSPFVFCNFGRHQLSVESRLSQIMCKQVKVTKPSVEELDSQFKSHQKKGSGIGEITFLLRAFTPEEELADTLSAAFGGISWDRSNFKGKAREWRCALAISDPEGNPSLSVKAMFRISQRSRKDVSAEDNQVYADVIQLVCANLSGGSDDESLSDFPVSGSPRSSRPLPFSSFSVEFPVASTFVVLSFLESKLPGVAFLTYKREEGNPQLDSVVFGKKSHSICDHPFAMKIKNDGVDLAASNPVATCVVGFDLRLVKDFSARPTAGEDGLHSFELNGGELENVLNWWSARNPIQDRVRAFMGLEPGAEFIAIPGLPNCSRNQKASAIGEMFREGGKYVPKEDADLQGPVMSTKDAVARASHQPDLKDANLLRQCRAVVVDLGNACWTHRHFSEDIQTRQYRAPEVLIGSKYDTSADMWSLGCITFELLTGDLLFDPRAGEDYDRDEDHLAMFQELLGKMPKRLSLAGKYSKNFFDRKGTLKHIKQLKFWPVQEVLCEKYHFDRNDAEDVADFIRPLLEFDPEARHTALQALRSPWLQE